MKKHTGFIIGVAAVLLLGSIGLVAQETPVVSPEIQEAASSALDQALTFIDSSANYLGQGVLYILNLVTGDRVSDDLQKPIGYLALITLILILFGLLDVARRIIWIGIIVGWVLLIVRIILDALNL